MNFTVPIAVAAVLLSGITDRCSGRARSATRPTFEQKKQCAELGWKTYDRFVEESKRMAGRTDGTLHGEPRFAFDPLADTCYCEFETTNFGNGPDGTRFTIRAGYLYDVLTNQTLAAYGVTERRGAAADSFGDMPESQYKEKRKQLMGY